MWIYSLLLLALGGITKSFMDLSSEGNLPWKQPYFSKADSWKSKWKTIDGELVVASKGDNWWYLGIIKPKYKERFMFSSTSLVSFTDFWHLSQAFFLKFIILGAYFCEPITHYQLLDLCIIYLTMLIPFELTYSYFKNKTK